jgi:hypothetical protein
MEGVFTFPGKLVYGFNTTVGCDFGSDPFKHLFRTSETNEGLRYYRTDEKEDEPNPSYIELIVFPEEGYVVYGRYLPVKLDMNVNDERLSLTISQKQDQGQATNIRTNPDGSITLDVDHCNGGAEYRRIVADVQHFYDAISFLSPDALEGKPFFSISNCI